MSHLSAAIWLLMISPFVGSFVAVLADRLPARKDVIITRSRCTDCSTVLSAHDLIPLLSYLMLKGKCRHCSASIPAHLFWSEALAVLLASAAVYCGDDPVQIVCAAVWMWVLLALALADATTLRLPDPLTLTLALSGLALAMTTGGLGAGLVSAAIAAGVFWLIRLAYFQLRGREGLGFGDVKLMVGIGAALPVTTLPVVTLLAALAALGVAWAFPKVVQSVDRAAALPFGTFLAAAAAVVWIALNIRVQ